MNMTDLSQLMWGLKLLLGWDFYLNLQLLTYTEVVMLFMRSG